MKLLNANILVCPKIRNDKIILSDGKELFLDTRFEVGKHAEVVCEVMMVPDQKIAKARRLIGDWECEMDIQVGDEVYCNYLVINSLLIDDDTKRIDWTRQNIIDYEGKRCIIINFKDIFVIKRENKIIMANGYVLLEPYENENIQFGKEKSLKALEKYGIKVPDTVKANKSFRIGKVKYIGKPNSNYRVRTTKWIDSEDVHEGDIVIFRKERDILLEYDLHASLEGKKKFFRVQNHDILMKIEI